MGVAEDLKRRINALQGDKEDEPKAKPAKKAAKAAKPAKPAKATKPAKKAEKVKEVKKNSKPVKNAKPVKKAEKPKAKAKATKPAKNEKRSRGGFYGHPRTLDRDKDTDGLRPFERKMLTTLEKAGGELPMRNLAAKVFGIPVDDVPGEAADGKPCVRAVRNGVRIPIKLGFAALTGRGVVSITKLWKNRDKSGKKSAASRAKEANESKRSKRAATAGKPKKIKTGRSKRAD